MRRVLGVVLLVAAGLTVGGKPASACSCAPGDPRRALSAAAGAFVGELTGRQGAGTLYRYRVDRALKGGLGTEVEVRSAASGDACGLATPVGQRAGLLLQRDADGGWRSSLCAQLDPDVLLRVAQPVPPPDGSGPATFLVATGYGEGRTLALDARGRVVAVGKGEGTTEALAVCPGSRTEVEVFSRPSDRSAVGFRDFAVRALPDLAPRRQLSLPGLVPEAGAFRGVDALACLDEAGEEAVLFVREELSGAGTGSTRYRGRILRLRGGLRETVWTGPARHGGFAPDGRTAYVAGGETGGDLLAVPLVGPTAGRAAVVARVPPLSGPPVGSPDGRRLAAVSLGPDLAGPAVLVMVDLASAPVTVLRASPAARSGGRPGWDGSDELVFAPTSVGEPVSVYDVGLRTLAEWRGWDATSGDPVLSDGRLYGTAPGAIRTALARGGPTALFRDLEGSPASGLVLVPGSPPPEAMGVGDPADSPPAGAPPSGSGAGAVEPDGLPAPPAGGRGTRAIIAALALLAVVMLVFAGINRRSTA